MENFLFSYDDMMMNVEENIGNMELYENFIVIDIIGKEIIVY